MKHRFRHHHPEHREGDDTPHFGEHHFGEHRHPFFHGEGPGRRGGRGGGPGPHRARRGALRHVLLDTLSDGPKHGYEIIKLLQERTYGQYAPSPGTVYPTLQYLEELGLIQADATTERRVYRLTEAGRAERNLHTAEVAAFWANFTGAAASESCQHEVGFLRDEIGNLMRTVWSGLRGALERGDREQVRRVRQTIEACRNDIREIIASGASAVPEGEDV